MTSKKAKGVYDKRSFRIDFSTWNMASEGRPAELLQKLLAAVIKDACKIASTEYECDAEFKCDTWTGKGKLDPDEIEVWLPLGAHEFEDPKWRFSLQLMIRSLIGNRETTLGSPISDEEDRKILEAVRDHLRRLASQLEDVLNRVPDNA
jgi:hypothetical protein